MLTINNNYIYEETIKKSKFITYLFPITSLEEAKQIIKNKANEHKDATHVCYAYIIDENTYKYYDDGEPTNSAGIPMYQVLKNNKLCHVLAIVVRYYGGIKLGTGGLAHAYSNGIITSLNQIEIIDYISTNEYIIEIGYSLFDELSYFLNKKGIVIKNKQFLDTVFISVDLSDNQLKDIKNNFINISIVLSK